MRLFSNIARRLATVDLDEVFCYHTVKEVRMLDRRLGALCWLIRLLIAGYVIGYVFIMNEGFTQQEVATGHIVTEVDGNAFSMSRGIARAWEAGLTTTTPPPCVSICLHCMAFFLCLWP